MQLVNDAIVLILSLIQFVLSILTALTCAFPINRDGVAVIAEYTATFRALSAVGTAPWRVERKLVGIPSIA